jgi:hypothetical protein
MWSSSNKIEHKLDRQRTQGTTSWSERGIFVSKIFFLKKKEREKGYFVVFDICSRLRMLRQWIVCFLSASDSDGGENVWSYLQVAIQGVILCIGYVLFGSLAIKGLNQVRLLTDSRNAVLNFRAVFDNPDLVAEIVS